MDEIKAVINELKSESAGWLQCCGDEIPNEDRAFYQNYLQIHAVQFEADEESEGFGESVIQKGNQLLDAIELERSFPVQATSNPILRQLEQPKLDPEGNVVRGHNESIKKSRLVQNIEQERWQLLGPHCAIRDTAHIAGNDQPFSERLKKERERGLLPFKRFAYYAIVQTDGDGMGEAIKNCKTCEDLADFSRRCLRYAQEGAKLVREYGGITIYAGGDDLLFIAPLDNEGNNGQWKGAHHNLFELLNGIRTVFDGCFEGFQAGSQRPTLSLGVAICYYKFPLYEAFNLAYRMLHEEAKNAEAMVTVNKTLQTIKKNALALTLRKHSGKSVELLFPQYNRQYGEKGCLKAFTDLLQALEGKDANELAFLSSVPTQLDRFQALFGHALRVKSDGAIENAFQNVFDGELHRNNSRVKEYIKLGFYLDYTTGLPVIPGSTVKGALRSVFRQHLAAGKEEAWEYIKELCKVCNIDGVQSKEAVEQLESSIFGEWVSNAGKPDLPLRDVFYDAVPVLASQSGLLLNIESITPHNPGCGSLTRLLQEPTPLKLLKVRPEVCFLFRFGLKDTNPTAESPLCVLADAKLELFKRILLDFGIGAKTNVGFGVLEEPTREIAKPYRELQPVAMGSANVRPASPPGFRPQPARPVTPPPDSPMALALKRAEERRRPRK
ncbi:MAG: type III-B CRISPR module RAMP protein Cmr6 [Christensenellaceae bacterium]|jgi:CRISPR-associated protein Cmr2|nr:type III-B CRISPR module RAMP protein Cmr6 [Christensenellaceae bacterium]